MDETVRLFLFLIAGGGICFFLQETSPPYAKAVGLAVGITALLFTFDRAAETVAWGISEAEKTGISSEWLDLAWKGVGIGWLAEIASQVGRSAGQEWLGKVSCYAGRAAILALSLPLLKEIFSTAEDYFLS